MQRTLILLKWDTIERGLSGEILARFERAGMRIENCRFMRPSLQQWQTHYADLAERNPQAFSRSTQYLQSKPVIAAVLAGDNVIAKARAICGPTEPLSAPAGTIRGDYSADSVNLANAKNRALFNLVHASDSEESALREINFWFS